MVLGLSDRRSKITGMVGTALDIRHIKVIGPRQLSVVVQQCITLSVCMHLALYKAIWMIGGRSLTIYLLTGYSDILRNQSEGWRWITIYMATMWKTWLRSRIIRKRPLKSKNIVMNQKAALEKYQVGMNVVVEDDNRRDPDAWCCWNPGAIKSAQFRPIENRMMWRLNLLLILRTDGNLLAVKTQPAGSVVVSRSVQCWLSRLICLLASGGIRLLPGAGGVTGIRMYSSGNITSSGWLVVRALWIGEFCRVYRWSW